MEPLPRPQQERLDLPHDQHLAFWYQVIRDFPWAASRAQSLALYRNVANAPYEGEIGS